MSRTTHAVLVALALAAPAAGQNIGWQVELPVVPRLPYGVRRLAACSAAARTYLSGDEDCDVRVVDESRMVIRTVFPTPSSVRELFHHDQTCRLYCASSEDDELYVFDCRTGDLLATVELDGVASAWAYASVEGKLYLLVDEQRVQALDLATDSVVATLDIANAWEETRRPLCYASNENVLFCTDEYNGVVAAVDCRADTLLGVIELGGEPCALAYNPANSRVYCARAGDDTLFVIEASTRQVVARVAGACPTLPRLVEVNAAHGRVYCGGQTVVVVDAATNSIRGTVEARGVHGGFVQAKQLQYDSVNARLYAITFECPWCTPTVFLDGESDSVVAQVDGPGHEQAVCRLGADQGIVWITSPGPYGWVHALRASTGASCGTWMPDVFYDEYASRPGTQRLAVAQNAHIYLADAATGGTIAGRGLGFGGIRAAFIGGGLVAASIGRIDSHTPAQLVVMTMDSLDVLRRHLLAEAVAVYYDSIAARLYLSVPDTSGTCVIHVFDSTADRSLGSVGIPECCGLMVAARGGSRLVAMSGRGVHVVDVEQMRLLASYQNSLDAYSFCVDAPGDRGYYLLQPGSAVCRLDLETGFVLDTIPLCSLATGMCYDRATERLHCWRIDESPVVEVVPPARPVERWFFTLPRPPSRGWNVAPGVLLFNSWSPFVMQYDCATGYVHAPVDVGFYPDDWYLALGGDSLVLVAFNSSRAALLTLAPPRPGVGETGSLLPSATLVRGVLRMADGSRQSAGRAVLLDAAGRKVLDLKAGDNDVSRLAPGIYFVRGWGSGTRGEGAGVTKVIVAR